MKTIINIDTSMTVKKLAQGDRFRFLNQQSALYMRTGAAVTEHGWAVQIDGTQSGRFCEPIGDSVPVNVDSAITLRRAKVGDAVIFAHQRVGVVVRILGDESRRCWMPETGAFYDHSPALEVAAVIPQAQCTFVLGELPQHPASDVEAAARRWVVDRVLEIVRRHAASSMLFHEIEKLAEPSA